MDEFEASGRQPWNKGKKEEDDMFAHIMESWAPQFQRPVIFL